MSQFHTGDRVIYTRFKYSNKPGPRARNINPARKGETYEYQVDKYWIVSKIQGDGAIVLQTRKGKQHVVTPEDPCLRKASLWERLFKHRMFPTVEPTSSSMLHATAK